MTKAETIKEYMAKYGITEAEATEMYDFDNEVDHMTMKEINATMTDAERKAVKDATKTTSGKRKQTEPKERKKDEEKRNIIAELWETAKSFDENAQIVKEEKEITFKIGENDYSISLIRHRASKK